jgi:hypothetical protein
MSTVELNQTGAKALALFVAWKTVGLNRDKDETEKQELYHETVDDRLAADLASKYSEGTLRCAAVMGGLLARDKLPEPEIKTFKKKRKPNAKVPEGDALA